MGYRNYIASLPKSEYDTIKNFNKSELFNYKGLNINENSYIRFLDILEGNLYELGKYCDSYDKKFFSPFFTNEELQNYISQESEFFIVGKEFLKHVIEDYNNKIKTFYSNILNDNKADLLKFIKENASEWLQLTPYDLDNGPEVTNSWKYEYAIFELIRIYKSFDWGNNKMIYYGY
jgi:hypothetical protein